MEQTKTEQQIRNERIQKLNMIKDAGVDPYPAKSKRTNYNADITKSFKSFNNKKVTVVGRVMSLRTHGRISFATIKDFSGEIQLAFKEDTLGKENYKFLRRFDMGDFIEATGKVFKTKAGEISVDVSGFTMLTKSLKPLPEKFHGLKDEELKLRKRYLDILLDDEVKEMVIKKSKFWQTMRNFLISEGFLEVETPAIETTTGGADARPFSSHHHALDMDVFFRISCGELWQKRLMVAGLEKTFEIGRIFRNEGMSHEHLQDYTQMEFYWGYSDYEKGMKLIEKLYKTLAKETFGTLKFEIGKFKVDLGKKWEIYSYPEIIKRKTKVDIKKADLKTIEAKLKELKIEFDKKGLNKSRATDLLWKYCRKSIAGPGFLIDVPVEIEPLAKRKTDDPETVQRFQVIIAGSEVGKGYSELNDPIDQADRFKAQQALRDAGDEEAQMNDAEFVEALEYGMPPTFGFGVSERLFAFLTNKPVRETQIFPLMRPLEKKKK
jgi:lysyl-tRNA synthetase class 2